MEPSNEQRSDKEDITVKDLADLLEEKRKELIEQSQNQPPEISRAIEDNFWDLF